MDKKKILVVEDDEFQRQIYVDTLTDQNYLVDSAANGDEAYQKIKQTRYDLLLIDVILPGMDGFTLVKKLQAEYDRHIMHTIIIYLTQLDNADLIQQVSSLGSGYLVKSQITPGDLAREVKVYLDKASETNSQ